MFGLDDAPALSDLVNKSFLKEMSIGAGDIRQLFHKEQGDAKMRLKRVYELDRERLAKTKVEGEASVQRRIAQGYYKDIEQKTISVTRVISGESFRNLTKQGLVGYATGTAEDVKDKIELDMTNFISYGEADSYTDNGGFTIDTTTGDAESLFNTVHTLKNSSTTYSNILTGAPSLSEASIDDAEDYFKFNVMDNYGMRIQMRPNAIITTEKSTMVNRVNRIFKSNSPEAVEGTANTNSGVKNVNKHDKYRHLILPYFNGNALMEYSATKNFYWLLASIGGSVEKSFSGYYVSWLSPHTAPVTIDQDKWILSFVSRAVYGIGAVSGKGILLVKATA